MVGVGLTWWWSTLLLLVAAVAVAGYAWWSATRRRPGEDTLLVAHSRRLTRLPGYRAALGRQRLRLGVLLGLLAVVLLPLAVAAGRPASTDTIEPEKRNRDIMLCLDVSGSMYTTDQALLEDFAQIVENFEGERIGLVLFDNQAVTAFPLTDDYELVRDQLEGYAEGFDFGGSREYDPLAGTLNPRIRASSLVSDGLASCVFGFDHEDEDRPRAVILGTDNMQNGEGIYTLEEAAELAEKRNVRVYALNPLPFGRPHEQLSEATEQTGGQAWELGASTSTDEVTEEIQRLEAARIDSPAPVQVRTDLPTVPIVIALLGITALYPLLWWWRR